MIIALIHYRFIQKGGLETRLINYLNWFSSRGHHIILICSKYDPSIKLPPNVEIVRLKLGLMPKKLRQWYFNVKLGRFMAKKRFDFSLSMGRTSHQDAVLAPSNHLGYLRALNQKPKSLSDRLQIYLDRISYQNSRYIFAASQKIRNELIELYQVDKHKIQVLFPPLNPENFDAELKKKQQELKVKYGAHPGKKTFLFVSTNHKLKGMDLLYLLFSSLPPEKYELLVLGNRSAFKAENIIYLDYIFETAEIYAAADFLIHPSKYDAFGQIVSEALESNTPVIISDQCGASEIITQHTGRVLPLSDYAQWHKTIIEIQAAQFKIPASFSEKNGIDLNSHCTKMLHLAGINKSF